MRTILILASSAFVLVGCSSSSGTGDDTAVKPGSGEIMKPSGSPQEEAMGQGLKQQGAMMNDARAQAAAAEAAAKAKTGGK